MVVIAIAAMFWLLLLLSSGQLVCSVVDSSY